MHLTWFFAGLVLGATIGAIAAAVCSASKD